MAWARRWWRQLSVSLCCFAGALASPSGRTAHCVRRYADALDAVRAGLGSSIRGHPLQVARTSERKLVLGAGSGRTGTRALAEVLAELGYISWHWLSRHSPGGGKGETGSPWTYNLMRILGGQVLPRVEAALARQYERPRGAMRYEGARRCRAKLRSYDFADVPDSVDAIMDTPAAELFLALFLSFPRARVVLTTRPSADWTRARLRHHVGNHTFVPLQEPCGLTLAAAARANFFSSADLERMYVLNNELVRCLVPPEQLLILELPVAPSEGSRLAYRQVMRQWLREFLRGGGSRRWRGRNRTVI